MRNMCPTIKSWLVFSDIVVLLPFRITVGIKLCNTYWKILPYEIEKKKMVPVSPFFLYIFTQVCVRL